MQSKTAWDKKKHLEPFGWVLFENQVIKLYLQQADPKVFFLLLQSEGVSLY